MHAESKPHRPEPSDHELEYAWRRGKLIIILGDGEAVPVDKVDGDATATVKKEVIVHNSGGQIENLFVEPIIIKLRPKLVRIRHYLRGETRRAERIYPKSTGGWYGRMESGIEMAAFIVHSIVDEDGSWLTVIDPNSAEILESHRVRPFEAEALVPSPPPRYDLMPDDSTAGRRKILEPLLNQAPPTWKQLYSLTRGISLAPLRTGDSMREAMDYLVPKRWSQSVREEVMAFLSLIVTGQDELTEDPVTYFDRLKVTPSLRTLLVIHQIALLGGLEVPDYLSIFHEKTRSELLAMRWYDAFSEFERPALVFNNPFTDVARQYIAKLNKQEGFALRLPISSSEAAKSREARLHRLVLLYQGIGISGRVNRRAIGLKTLYYLGKAHGWPHRHLSFSARLGEDDENPLLLHEIVVPPDAAEQLLRMRSGLMQRDWYHRWENHGALQESQKQVQREMDRIKQNLEVGVSEKRLLRRFHIKDPSPYELKKLA
ncbi:MAG: hypothetical protein JSW61_13375 [Candidatus Thorarchaeota archaeon]|nr:MAG: hypothetical protein JSW61_13375 [Candidatus Thorarchaeota archaeon]